jgi:hypothetical protein
LDEEPRNLEIIGFRHSVHSVLVLEVRIVAWIEARMPLSSQPINMMQMKMTLHCLHNVRVSAMDAPATLMISKSPFLLDVVPLRDLADCGHRLLLNFNHNVTTLSGVATKSSRELSVHHSRLQKSSIGIQESGH